jgi:nickel-dependent lactate racemase
MKVPLKHNIWSGERTIELNLPDAWKVSVLHMAGDTKKVLGPDEYRRTLAPLQEKLKGKKEICVVFDDLSRPTRTYQILPYLLEVFEKARLRDEQVRFICALGTHIAFDNAAFRKKLGEEVMERFTVYNHNPYENCERLGQTRLGTPIMVNKEFLACDFRIGIGSFLAHGFCGYGGGYKIVMPGIAHIDSIAYHHGTLLNQNPEICRAGDRKHNPLLEDLKEFGRKARLDVKIDALVNTHAETVDLCAEEPDEVYARFGDSLLAHYGTQFPGKADIVFVNTFAKGNEAVIALSLAAQMLKDGGGDVVLLADIPEGQVVHYLFGRFGKETWGRLPVGERVNDPKIRRIFIFSRFKDPAGCFWYGRKEEQFWYKDLDAIVKLLDEEYKGSTPSVHVIPDGTIQMANLAQTDCVMMG